MKFPDFLVDAVLNKIKNLKISPGAILASLDVVSLYTNIPHKEGIASVHKATLESESPRVEATTLAELTKIVLKNNILEFAGENFLQVQGTAMGTKLAQPVHGGRRETLANASPPRQDRHVVLFH